jgi:hypothetical protein
MYKATLMAPDGTPETINLFDMVVEGAKLNGEIYTNDKGYRNFKNAQSVAGGAYKTAQVEKLMDKKSDSIATAQNNKENGIRVASTMSGAVTLAVAQFKSEPNDLRTLEELVEYYRRYLWLEWENVNHLPPFK